VANGIKKGFQRLFPDSLQIEVRNKIACFVIGLDDFSDRSSLDVKGTMNPIKWWTCHGSNGVYLQNLTTHILSQETSSSSA
jgi:hypothetical protein